MYTRPPHYLYQRNGIYYYAKKVPRDLKTRFYKNRVVISLKTHKKQWDIQYANLFKPSTILGPVLACAWSLHLPSSSLAGQ